MAQGAPTQRAGAAQHAAQAGKAHQPAKAGKAHQPAKSGASRTVGAAGIRRAFVAAFPYTVPIMAGFVFLGLACGIYSHSLGLPVWVPTLMSVLIFAGSSEFVVAFMLTGAFNPLQVFLTAFVVNARHLFYGISMLERFRGLGPKRFYLIFGMCDETFSINYATQAPDGVDRGWFMFFITILNQLYWVVGCTLGGVFGTLLDVDASGLSFAMTALFVVIFLGQWLKEPTHASSLVGVGLSLAALLVFGPDSFIIPAMVWLFWLLVWRCVSALSPSWAWRVRRVLPLPRLALRVRMTPQLGRLMPDDHAAAGSHHARRRGCHGAYAQPPVCRVLFGRQDSARGALPGRGAAAGGFRAARGVLPAQRGRAERRAWAAGVHRHRRHGCASPVEAWRRNMLISIFGGTALYMALACVL